MIRRGYVNRKGEFCHPSRARGKLTFKAFRIERWISEVSPGLAVGVRHSQKTGDAAASLTTALDATGCEPGSATTEARQ